jgi:hypothetical protein
LLFARHGGACMPDGLNGWVGFRFRHAHHTVPNLDSNSCTQAACSPILHPNPTQVDFHSGHLSLVTFSLPHILTSHASHNPLKFLVPRGFFLVHVWAISISFFKPLAFGIAKPLVRWRLGLTRYATQQLSAGLPGVPFFFFLNILEPARSGCSVGPREGAVAATISLSRPPPCC